MFFQAVCVYIQRAKLRTACERHFKCQKLSITHTCVSVTLSAQYVQPLSHCFHHQDNIFWHLYNLVQLNPYILSLYTSALSVWNKIATTVTCQSFRLRYLQVKKFHKLIPALLICKARQIWIMGFNWNLKLFQGLHLKKIMRKWKLATNKKSVNCFVLSLIARLNFLWMLSSCRFIQHSFWHQSIASHHSK